MAGGAEELNFTFYFILNKIATCSKWLLYWTSQLLNVPHFEFVLCFFIVCSRYEFWQKYHRCELCLPLGPCQRWQESTSARIFIVVKYIYNNSVALSNSYHCASITTIHLQNFPNWNSLPLRHYFSILHCPQPLWTTILLSVPVNLITLDTPHKWNHTILALLWLAYFS